MPLVHRPSSGAVSRAPDAEVTWMPIDIAVALDAVVAAVSDDEPRVLVRSPGERLPADALPAGTFDPDGDATLDAGLRRWVTEQAQLDLGHLEQLYTFGDRGRDGRRRVLSVAYLAFVRESAPREPRVRWHPWYRYFPWEDWRDGRPAVVEDAIFPAVEAWVAAATDPEERRGRQRRARRAVGTRRGPWNEELVLERYELFWEIGLVAESRAPGPMLLGERMAFDHRRILATALGRVRGALRYRPLVFELLPPDFTLPELQQTVEALAGRRLHAPNFRRLVEEAVLVEPTGAARQTAGRPAKLLRYRPDAIADRPDAGIGFR
jgi:hypothetical protein